MTKVHYLRQLCLTSIFLEGLAATLRQVELLFQRFAPNLGKSARGYVDPKKADSLKNVQRFDWVKAGGSALYVD